MGAPKEGLVRRLAVGLCQDPALQHLGRLVLRPLLDAFSRSDGEVQSFGDWAVEQDWAHLQSLLPAAASRRRGQVDPDPAT